MAGMGSLGRGSVIVTPRSFCIHLQREKNFVLAPRRLVGLARVFLILARQGAQ